MKKENGGKNVPSKPIRQKIFGTNSLQFSQDDAFGLVGGIVEKGISEEPHRSPIAAPRPTLLPFPVARHRSHAPHWVPKGSESSGSGVHDDDDEDDEENEDLQKFDQISVSANPVQRKQKKDMDFSRWRELITSNNSTVSPKKEENKHLSVESKRQKKVSEINETSDKLNSHVDSNTGAISKRMSPDRNVKAHDVNMEDVGPALLEKMSPNVITRTSGEIVDDMYPGNVSRKQRRLDTEKLNPSASHITSSSTSNNLEKEKVSVSVESQIDAENRARLQRMSAGEIEEAQAEILDKMKPALIEALRKRGQDKLKKNKYSSSDTNGELSHLQDEKNSSKDANGSPLSESGISHKLTRDASQDTHRTSDNKAVQHLKLGSGNLWDAWSNRVEAVRELRFSLDGDVIRNDIFEVPKSGNISVHSGYNADNVSERDFLRTDGDPGAVGYTLKEAVALTRSVVPGQRALALHLLASVLDKALHNICQNKVGCNVKNAETDWEAIWAFALGPEPELVLSLRMCLDDNHNSVVLACTKVIQSTLSCDMNESIFDMSEKTAILSDVCTAPVFRSRPEIDVGFLHGGFWKYNAKPSNILPFIEDIMDNKTEDEHTIQDDIFVAGQDFAAGLVRMGILPRIRYLLETDPSAALEECIISILVAIARHSPTGANAIMECQRLVQTVVDRFTTKDHMEINPCKLKSVTLLKVLARSEKKNCTYFVKKGIFQIVTWHLCRYAISLDQWVRLGTENCKLSSALVVEQLRLWKVCVQYGYGVSYFSDLFPALCIWLNVPSFEKLLESDVLSVFAAITKEAYLVLEALARRLPNFYSHLHLENQIPEAAEEDTETWSWSHVGPMVDLALKWLALSSDSSISKLCDWKKGNESGSVIENSPVLWVISAVMRMLSAVLERLIPEDIISLPGGHVPWIPEFVPKIGLEIIKNEFLSFSTANGRENGKDSPVDGSFAEYLCQLRHQNEHEMSIASISCLHGLIRVVVSIDKLIQAAKSEIQTPFSKGHVSSREGAILAGGITNLSLVELRSVLTVFMRLIDNEWDCVQSIEVFGRGGPAPGVGVGWGASGGGFWSLTVLLAQVDARLLISLLEVFKLVSANGLSTVEDMNFTLQKINSVLGVCLIAGPRDGLVVDKALDILLQVPVLKHLDLCIRRFLSTNRGLKLVGWGYEEEDYEHFSKILASHFRIRWLSVKKKSKAVDGKSCVGQKMSKKGSNALDTIHEELDTSNLATQDHYCTSLVVEWAHQRLPLPRHWFLSPISTINHNNPKKNAQDLPDFLEVAKSGLFFLLGIEAMSFSLSSEIPSPVRSVPVIWKLHSLSVVLLVGMGVLEEGKSRDTYETLQDVYGQLIDESRSSKSSEIIAENNEKLLDGSEEKNNVEFLRFQLEIHESYSTFVETLVEQFGSISYGDLIYGRQVAIYLHRCVEATVRLATWNALSNARVLELLPPLDNCIAKAEGYLEPVEDNEGILEAYVKSWVSGALDRAAARGSIAFTLVLHHLSSFIFCHDSDYKLLRYKLVKTLLRDYSRKQQHEGMMLDLIQYSKPPASQNPGQEEGSSLLVCSNIERRFNLLTEACEGNSSLLNHVLKLKSSFQEKL